MLQASLALRINALSKQGPDVFNKVISRVNGSLRTEGTHKDLAKQLLERRLLSSDEAKLGVDPNILEKIREDQ